MVKKKRNVTKPLGRRPKKPEDRERRPNRLTIMLWDAERSELDYAAGRGGIGTSTWAREVLLREAAK